MREDVVCVDELAGEAGGADLERLVAGAEHPRELARNGDAALTHVEAVAPETGRTLGALEQLPLRAQLVVGGLALGDVEDDAENAHGSSVGATLDSGLLAHPAHLAVGRADDAVLDLGKVAGLERVERVLHHPLAVVGMDDVEEALRVAALDLFVGEAEDALRLGRPLVAALARIEDPAPDPADLLRVRQERRRRRSSRSASSRRSDRRRRRRIGRRDG